MERGETLICQSVSAGPIVLGWWMADQGLAGVQRKQLVPCWSLLFSSTRHPSPPVLCLFWNIVNHFPSLYLSVHCLHLSLMFLNPHWWANLLASVSCVCLLPFSVLSSLRLSPLVSYLHLNVPGVSHLCLFVPTVLCVFVFIWIMNLTFVLCWLHWFVCLLVATLIFSSCASDILIAVQPTFLWRDCNEMFLKLAKKKS